MVPEIRCIVASDQSGIAEALFANGGAKSVQSQHIGRNDPHPPHRSNHHG